MKSLIRILDQTLTTYLKSQLETGDSVRAKKSLQEICKHYRDGYRIHPSQLAGVEQTIVGLLYTQANDEKVRRWALNALARLGREPQCMEAIIHTLHSAQDHPQISASAIAAIFRMSRKATSILKRLNFDEQMKTLAALQHVDANKLDLSTLPINVDNASPDLLKLALVLVGLDRAPAKLMHPRMENAELVRALGGHHDNIVAQYTVWAVTENPSLGLRDIGIDIKLVEDQPPNVRAWIFRLIAMNPEDAERNFEYIELGSRDPDDEPRAGLALGLKRTYFDGIEALVIDWFLAETNTDVRQHLLDHMILNYAECQSYQSLILDIYEKESENSSLRRSMEATASGTRLFGIFKQIQYSSEDLFGGGITVNNNYNISGGIQGGAVSVGGNASNSGSTNNSYDNSTIELIQTELARLERELHESNIDLNVKQTLLSHIADAKSDPSPSRLQQVLHGIRQAGEVVLAGTSIWEIGHLLARLGGLG